MLPLVSELSKGSSNIAGSVDERSERLARILKVPLLVAVLFTVPVIVIEQAHAGDPWKDGAAIANWAIWSAFAFEVVAMLSVVPDRKGWLRGHLLELAIVILTPPFLPSSLQAARLFRLLRLLRLVWLVKFAKELVSVEGVRYAAILAGFTALGGGAAFAEVEHRSTWTGVYWAVSTMTTVGYGDVHPDTDAGRAIAMGVMLVGIGFLTLVIGAVSQKFIASEVEQVEEEVAEELQSVEEALRELREVMGRLQRLEAAVQRLGRA
jgi:voltage-gated potassium channel